MATGSSSTSPAPPPARWLSSGTEPDSWSNASRSSRAKFRLRKPAYEPYDCFAGEARIAGTVFWTVGRV